MEVATSPPVVRISRQNSRSHKAKGRKQPETVDTEGLWCCIVRPKPLIQAPDQQDSKKELLVEDFAESGTKDRSKNNRNMNGGNSAEIVLRSGDIAALIKQGIVGGTSSSFRLRLSPGRVSPVTDGAIVPAYGYGKSSRGIGSSPPVDKIKSSPTLFEMMALEQELHQGSKSSGSVHAQQHPQQQIIVPLMRPVSVQEKVDAVLLRKSPGNKFNDSGSSDVKLTLSGKDGFIVTVNVHRHILMTQSRYFAAKLSDWWMKQHKSLPQTIEILDCDDIEIYLQTIRLMYCRDLRRSLLKENVTRVLGILKISAAILFEAGVLSCLEYLEAMPWPEEEEDKVISLITQLQLDELGATEVLHRINGTEMTESEAILVRLVQSVIKGTDDRARKEMKALMSKLLRENAFRNRDPTDSSKECFYRACSTCLESLKTFFEQAAKGENQTSLITQIARQADNLNWLLDILVDRHIADDFTLNWAHRTDLAGLYTKIPTNYRYEVSRITARLCIAIGKGQILAPKEVRFALLHTWLQPLIDDFGWIQRCCKSVDKKAVEEGISQTILTLPLAQQETFLLSWFDKFSTSGGDCPNLHKAFEVWWRRAFVRPSLSESPIQLTSKN